METAGIEQLSPELIRKAVKMAMKSQRNQGKQYLSEKSRSSPFVIFSFPGSWSVNEWFDSNQKPFGEAKIDRSEFPFLRSIGNDEDATLNQAFLKRYQTVTTNSSLHAEVDKAVKERKHIVFTGHSSGGAIAILMTIWYLQTLPRPDVPQPDVLCLTFGAPLVGDHILNHALVRENWAHRFIHFVLRYDIVPRIMLAPRSSAEHQFLLILNILNPNTQTVSGNYPTETLNFFSTVVKNMSSVASRSACLLMGNTNPLLETLSSFMEISPYRPFGTFVFCTGNSKAVIVKNPDAVLQILYSSCQLSHEGQHLEVACRSLEDHKNYQGELLDKLDKVPLFSNCVEFDQVQANLLNDLGTCPKAQLCLRAAGEAEKRKSENQNKTERKKQDIEKGLQALEQYKNRCEARKIGYYDSFRISREMEDDFEANLRRLELAGIWDEIVQMLRKYELPDTFEGKKEWTEIGTRYRRLVEPLDISNYYRHRKNEDTGPYTEKGRPKRYRYTQRWLEMENRSDTDSCSESCFWAEVEELSIMYKPELFNREREKILNLEAKLQRWIQSNAIGRDVLLEGSTFVKWWNKLPESHKLGSPISALARGL